jgi:hypothetical protein
MKGLRSTTINLNQNVRCLGLPKTSLECFLRSNLSAPLRTLRSAVSSGATCRPLSVLCGVQFPPEQPVGPSPYYAECGFLRSNLSAPLRTMRSAVSSIETCRLLSVLCGVRFPPEQPVGPSPYSAECGFLRSNLSAPLRTMRCAVSSGKPVGPSPYSTPLQTALPGNTMNLEESAVSRIRILDSVCRPKLATREPETVQRVLQFLPYSAYLF